MTIRVPVYFNEIQLDFKPLYEWAFGEKIQHPETTARAESILSALKSKPDRYEMREPSDLPLAALRQLHHANLLTLYNTARQLPKRQTFYPSVFPKDDTIASDPTNIHHAGAFCFDSGTPLNRYTWSAATWSAACAREAAEAVKRENIPLAYSLSRPPGHHATRSLFGGYCYFNNAAVAARYLRRFGRVAILDIDFHHGNGTQSIFYRDSKVLTVSIHGDPREFFPYYSGFSSETGKGAGEGFNLNIPLPRGLDGGAYAKELKRHALTAIRRFDPKFLVVSAGFDTYVKDPVGDFSLVLDDFVSIGELVARLGYPMVVVQEGGYYTRDLGRCADRFLEGLVSGLARRKLNSARV